MPSRKVESMFRLVATMRRGSSTSLPQASARYASIEAARLGAAELMREERIVAAPWPSDAPRLELLVTDLPASFDAAARRFLGTGTPAVTQIDLDLAP